MQIKKGTITINEIAFHARGFRKKPAHTHVQTHELSTSLSINESMPPAGPARAPPAAQNEIFKS